LATYNAYFTGSLDGKNHKIMNLYINRPTEDKIGLFKKCYAEIKNIMFVDAKIIGHNYVGVVMGSFCSTESITDIKNNSQRNITIINSTITGNESIGGVCGIYADNGKTIHMRDIFVDVEIQSNDGFAYGIGKIANFGKVECYNCYPFYVEGNTPRNCNCSSWCQYNQCNCASGKSTTYFQNCISKLRKNESITTYYSFSNNDYIVFENCYADNSEIQPVVYSGITYKNITDIQHEIDLLPNVDSNYFTKKVNATLEPKFLNNDAIYLQFNNGYHVYDFANNEFVQKYTKFSNENSKEIIQNGMDKVSFSKIPNSKLKEIQDKYGKVKVINCINAHKKIVYKTSVLEMGRDKAHSVYRKKIRFNDFNEITSIKKK